MQNPWLETCCVVRCKTTGQPGRWTRSFVITVLRIWRPETHLLRSGCDTCSRDWHSRVSLPIIFLSHHCAKSSQGRSTFLCCASHPFPPVCIMQYSFHTRDVVFFHFSVHVCKARLTVRGSVVQFCLLPCVKFVSCFIIMYLYTYMRKTIGVGNRNTRA